MGSSGGRGDLGFAQGVGPPTPALDFSSFRNVGKTPWEIWYFSGGITFATVAPTTDILYAMPYTARRGGRLDRLGFAVTTGGAAGSVGRCGIYLAESQTSLHPGQLLVDCGEKDCTSIAVKSTILDLELPPDQLVYFVFLCGVAAPTIRYTSGLTFNMGMQPDFATNNIFCYFNQAYGPLPRTFPKTATLLGGTSPLVACRYSA